MIFSKHNGYSPDGRRLCHKGGDGGASAMRQQEEERQARINAAIKTINDIFDPPAYKQGTNAATEFDPNKTYYNKDGSVFDAKKKFSLPSTGNLRDNIILEMMKLPDRIANPWDMDKINNAIAKGELFTGYETEWKQFPPI